MSETRHAQQAGLIVALAAVAFNLWTVQGFAEQPTALRLKSSVAANR